LEKQKLYKRAIIKEMFFAGPSTLAELSDKTDKSIPFVTKLLNELKDENVIIEDNTSIFAVGRPAQYYTILNDYKYIIAVALDQYITRISIVDMSRSLVRDVAKYELKIDNDPKTLQSLVKIINDYIKECGIPRNKIVGVGIGMPGFVDVKKGINHSFFSFSDNNLEKNLETSIGLKVLIDNDSSLIALAEHKYGAAKGRKNVMVLNIGWGVGLGMIINGAIFRGDRGFAGEFSHLPLFNNDKMCSCGKMGCLETETSLLVITKKAISGIRNGTPTVLKELTLDDLDQSIKKIIDAAINGDKFSVSLISEAGYHIGRGIAILVHLLNPELVLISGRGSRAGKLWITPIQQALNEHCIPKLAEHLEIQISELQYNAELLGAAALVMENYNIIDNRKPGKLSPKKSVTI
jgi:predicted NBD/HSP70 family sugar kinase